MNPITELQLLDRIRPATEDLKKKGIDFSLWFKPDKYPTDFWVTLPFSYLFSLKQKQGYFCSTTMYLDWQYISKSFDFLKLKSHLT
jgi:hypothetical protein